MANVERTTSWQQIQQGMKEAERLIARKEYNLVMVKARQTLEFMVRCMAERACLVEGDLSDTIDQLYEGRWIDKATKDNYHTIRILGNKAVHEGDDTAYDANQAYQLLTQEVYAFAHEFTGSKQGRSQASARSPVTRTATGRQGTSSQRSTAGSRNTQRTAARSSYSSAGRQSGSKEKETQKSVTGILYLEASHTCFSRSAFDRSDTRTSSGKGCKAGYLQHTGSRSPPRHRAGAHTGPGA